MAGLVDPNRLPEPPKPLAHDVRLVRADGTPTAEFHQFLSRRYEWDRLLRELLTTDPLAPRAPRRR